MTATRRAALKTLLAGAAVAPQLAQAAAQPKWGRGIEGQRKADLGNGTFSTPSSPAIILIPPSSRTATITT
jgi:xylan 1,4-beta-xylosidase